MTDRHRGRLLGTVHGVGEHIESWWAGLPLDRVVRLHGSSVRELAESVDPLPAGAPAVVFFALPAAHTRGVRDLVDDVVSALERAAVETTALWLPESDLFRGTSTLDGDARGVAVRRLAAESSHFGPYLERLTSAAATGVSPNADGIPLETRASGSASLVAAAYGKHCAALVLVVGTSYDPSVVATASEWLCARAGIGVWISGDDVSAVDRFPSVRVTAAALPIGVSTVVDRFRPLSYPPIVGHPHPGSEPEKILCRALDNQPWATGREHNRAVRLGSLSSPFTVDVLWRTERVVVEIDGDEHRAATKFGADRMRDNQLQTEGFIVLRFTNSQVIDDHEHVVATVGAALARRRSKGTTVER